MTPQDVYDQLSAPFATALISWRVGPTNERYRKEGEPLRGQPLCYIDARAVMDRLDSVVGFDNWQCNYTPGVAGAICNLGIRIAGEWIWKADGAGATDMEAEKGALSDAFKRAAVRFGIARYLYDLKAPWMVLEARGKSAIIPDAAQEELRRIYNKFARSLLPAPTEGVSHEREAVR